MVSERSLPFTPTSPVIFVGPRRPERRRLARLGWVSMAAAVAVIGGHVLASAPTPAPVPVNKAPTLTPFSELLYAEEAWFKRLPTAAEIMADIEQCAWAPGCAAPTALPWSQLHQMAAQQVHIWRTRGFSAQAAWDLYRERQMMGDADHDISSSHHQQLAPIEQFRLSMQKRLARVNTSADLRAYWASWKAESQRYGLSLAVPAGVGGLWSEQVQWITRLKGQGSGWSPFTAAQEDERWQRLEALVARDLSALPVGEVPARVTMGDADKRLLAAVQQSGLRQVRWPAVFPNTPEVKWRLASLLMQANQALQRATGWEGPVLGQAGHVVLALAATAAGDEQGAQTPLRLASGALDNVLVCAVIDRNDLGSLAHEWWHAHDFFVGSTSGSGHPAWASQLAAAVTPGGVWAPVALTSSDHPVSALWHQVPHDPLSPAQQQEAVLESWVGRWSYQQPLDRARWLAEAADVRGHRHTPEDSQARWSEHWPTVAMQELRDVSNPALPAPESLAQPAPTVAGWLRLSLQAPPPPPIHLPYWGAPPEVLARAFERQLADQRLFASDSQRVWLYYPQGMEKAWQTGVWQDYFKKQAPWWNKWKAAVPPEAPARTLGAALRTPPPRR